MFIAKKPMRSDTGNATAMAPPTFPPWPRSRQLAGLQKLPVSTGTVEAQQCSVLKMLLLHRWLSPSYGALEQFTHTALEPSVCVNRYQHG